MPMYEYRCRDCGAVAEHLEQANSRRRHACERCGSKKTEKAYSSFAARFARESASTSSRSSCASCRRSSCASCKP